MKVGMLIALATLTVSMSPAQRKDPSPQSDRDAAEPAAATWIKANLTNFETDVPTEAELAPLLTKVARAKLVGLGESTHGDHQSQVFKSQVIRKLIQGQGLNQVVFEINRSAGQALDAYVNLGQGDLSDVIRNRGVFKIWQTDDLASLIGWIRGYVVQTKKKVHIYGIDCQMPAKDLKIALAFLKKHDSETANQYAQTYASLFQFDQQGKTYLAWLKSQHKGDYAKFANPAKAIIKRFTDKRREWSKDPQYDEAAYAANTTYQAFNAFEFNFGPGQEDLSKLTPEYTSRRDKFMASNVLRRIGSERACLWAHDGHVMGSMPEEYTKLGYTSLGHELKLDMNSDYVTVGFTWSTGVIHAKVSLGSAPDLVALQKAAIPQVPVNANHKGDLGEFLGRIGPDNFYVDFEMPTTPLRSGARSATIAPNSAGFSIRRSS